ANSPTHWATSSTSILPSPPRRKPNEQALRPVAGRRARKDRAREGGRAGGEYTRYRGEARPRPGARAPGGRGGATAPRACARRGGSKGGAPRLRARAGRSPGAFGSEESRGSGKEIGGAC